MRFSNNYAQLLPENNLNIDLNPIYVDYLTDADVSKKINLF